MPDVTLESLRTADAAAAARFFAEVDPEQLVAGVAATGDDALLDLIGREEVRSAAVVGILERLHEYAVPERLAALEGVVRFDLERRGRLLERHALHFAAGTLTTVPRVAAGAHADVVMRTSLLRFVRLVTGERNAGLEYLGGHLDIEGDADLALAVGGLFQVPGTHRVAVDPRALDPVAVATVLGEVKPDHLRKVMRSGFRDVVLGEIFRRLPDFLDPHRAHRADVTVGFRLLGHPAGEIERYVVRVAAGAATVTEVQGHDDAGAGERHATVTLEGHDFLRLATGHLSPITGVLKGQLKVRGDKAKALQLAGLFDIPSAP